MREHQIVINLKREQFEEVQRLARLAGSKSVATYVRERVLALLALQQPRTSDQQAIAPSATELLEINQELTRMHRELQVFIAESLSTNAYNSDDDEEEDLDNDLYYAHQNLQQALERDLEDYRSQSSDTVGSAGGDPYPVIKPQFKQPPPFTLHRTNSAQAQGSPRSYDTVGPEQGLTARSNLAGDSPLYIGPDSTQLHGGIENASQQSSQPAGSATPDPTLNSGTTSASEITNASDERLNPAQQVHLNPNSDYGKSAANHSHSQPGLAVNFPDAITPGAWSGMPTSFVDNSGIYSSSTAESIWLTPPNQVLTPGYQNDGIGTQSYAEISPTNSANSQATGAQRPDPPAQPTGSASSGKRDQIGQPNDELEDLAERAFAISPRLGALDKPSSTPAGFRKRQIDDPLDDLIDDKIMEEAEKLRMASIEDDTPYDNSVVYAFDSSANEESGQPLQPASPEDLEGSDPAPTNPEYANDLALEIQARLQPPEYEIENLDASSHQSYSVGFSTEELSSTYETMTAPAASEDEQTSTLQPGPQDSDSAPPPPAPSAIDSPPPPAPRPDSSAVTGPPPKRRRLPDDQSPDDEDRISGGPPPKRRKK